MEGAVDVAIGIPGNILVAGADAGIKKWSVLELAKKAELSVLSEMGDMSALLVLGFVELLEGGNESISLLRKAASIGSITARLLLFQHFMQSEQGVCLLLN